MSDYVFTVEVCGHCGEQRTGGVLEGAVCVHCGHGEVTDVRFRVSRSQLLKQVGPEQSLVERTLYFGCWQQAGHYYWSRGMRRLGRSTAEERQATPWGLSVDGGLVDRNDRLTVGHARTFYKDGWTALAFTDDSVDSRPGSWSVYCIPATLGYDDALRIARLAFPQVFERYPWQIIRADPIPQ